MYNHSIHKTVKCKFRLRCTSDNPKKLNAICKVYTSNKSYFFKYQKLCSRKYFWQLYLHFFLWLHFMDFPGETTQRIQEIPETEVNWQNGLRYSQRKAKTIGRDIYKMLLLYRSCSRLIYFKTIINLRDALLAI